LLSAKVTAPADKPEKSVLESVQAFARMHIDIAKLGCVTTSLRPTSFSEILESRNSGFSYAPALASHLGVSVIAASVVAAISYLMVAVFGWIVTRFIVLLRNVAA
jgi:hypothetical protein